jgi:hypothetical protein
LPRSKRESGADGYGKDSLKALLRKNPERSHQEHSKQLQFFPGDQKRALSNLSPDHSYPGV